MSQEKPNTIFVEYKVIPRHRRTRQPVAQTGEVKVCFTMNLDEMHRLMNLVIPRVGLQNLIPDDQGKHVFAHSTARLLSEMYGAVVEYQDPATGATLKVG